MAENKFTDKEIMLALECCIKPTSDCDNCPLYIKGDGDCVTIVKQGALNIINGQQAKNEALQMDNAQLQNYVINANMNLEHLQAEIDILNAENLLTTSERNAFQKSFYEILKKMKIVKTETIKEFLNKLIDVSVCKDNDDGTESLFVSIPKAREISKEMVGENKNELL